jgi:formate dehydrogenase subunit beta
LIEKIRARAKELLESERVDVVIGWETGSSEERTRPAFITEASEVDRLVWNRYCFNNLSNYLLREEIRAYGKPAIISKGCDNRAIIVLMQEFQLRRDDVHILGVFCEGMGDNEPLAKCRHCTVHTPRVYDELIGEPRELPPAQEVYDQVRKLEQASAEERWEFWRREFEKCIRCYACRQVCPMCYCRRCIADKNVPQWIPSSAHPVGNFAWNVIRAFHLAGRCIECEECERACPANIKLMLLNRLLEKDVLELYGYEAGKDVDTKPVLNDFRDTDDESFIL